MSAFQVSYSEFMLGKTLCFPSWILPFSITSSRFIKAIIHSWNICSLYHSMKFIQKLLITFFFNLVLMKTHCAFFITFDFFCRVALLSEQTLCPSSQRTCIQFEPLFQIEWSKIINSYQDLFYDRHCFSVFRNVIAII